NCYKIKTTTPSASYTADLADLVAQPGCVIKVPAKLLCVETSKMNVIPTPPGSVVGGPAGRFLCYKAKCPNTAAPITVDDQFGSHTVTPSATKMVCAPAPTTTSTTTTTTLPGSGCSEGATPCGACPGGGVCEVHCPDSNTACARSSTCDPASICESDDVCPPGEFCFVPVGAMCGMMMGHCCRPCPGTPTPTTTIPPNQCDPNTPNACQGYAFGPPPSCKDCCDMSPACNVACTNAASLACASSGDNAMCAMAIQASGCAPGCCP